MRTRRRGRFLEASIILVLAGFCAASGLMLLELRRDTWEQAVTGEENLLNVLSQDIARNIEIYDLSLQAVVEGVTGPDLEKLSPTLQDRILYDRSTSAKDLGSILVLDRDGKIVRGSKPGLVGADVSDRDYFQAQKADPNRGLYISAPFQGRLIDKEQMVALSRSFQAADGSFAGVVVGTMRLAYFRKLFLRSDLGPRGAINLFRRDGTVLMRVPYDSGIIGRSFAASDNFKKFSSAEKGTLSAKASLDGVRRIYTFAHVGAFPLILDVALAEDDVFAVWRAKSITIGLALAVLCATAAALGWGLRRQLDNTARAEALLARREAQYRLLADNVQDVIVRLDRSLLRTYVSPAVFAVLGYKPDELLDRGMQEFVHPDDWAEVSSRISEAQAVQANTEATYRFRHKDGHYVWVEGRFSLVTEDGGFIVVLRDITRRKSAEEQLAKLNVELAHIASIDSLTSLPNRRKFDEVLDIEWRRAKREGSPVSLLMIDIDRFKAYNDRYGHQQGDACLRAVAGAIKTVVRRPGDLAARYGGEEMAVVLPATDAAGAAKVAESIRSSIAELRVPHEGNQSCGAIVTASLGCATLLSNDEAASSAALIEVADRRLYEAKRTGRNRVQASDPAAPIADRPVDESARLSVLAAYEQAGVPSTANLDQIAALAARLFHVPMAFVSLVGEDTTTVAGRHGLDTESLARNDSFCSHAIRGDTPLVVPDTKADPRFADNPCTLSGIGFYAGAPLESPLGGQRIGALCIADSHARPALDEKGRELLSDLAKLTMDEFERQRMASRSRKAADSMAA